MIRRISARRAFTLVELLTVVAIIAILAAILIPVGFRVSSLSRKARCVSNLRQVGSALLLYASENKGVFPAGSQGGVWSWKLVDKGYLSPAVYCCPADTYSTQPPAGATAGWGGRSYVYASPSMTLGGGPARVLDFNQPAKAFMLIEWHYGSEAAGSKEDYRSTNGHEASYDLIRNSAPIGHPEQRHNCAFVDGHVDSLTKDEALASVHWNR